jgi:dienelactone hydrolase
MRPFLISLLFAFAAGDAHAQSANETITLPSATYANFGQIFTHAAPDALVDVPATLGFPADTTGHMPAVVIVHTLAGFRGQNEGWQAQQLREAGFATLTYDSFAARGMGDLVATPMRGRPPYPSALADAFVALATLSRDPRIDPKRTAILGFSFGGEVAHDTAFERVRAALSQDQQRFAAHVAYYPAGVYGVVADANAYTGAPILLMIGDDDTLPVAKAEAYLTYGKAYGHPAPVELVTYAGAKHGWTDPGLGAAREYPYLASTRKCPFVLISQHDGRRLLVDGEARAFEDKGFEACIRDSLGYTMGYDEAVRRRSADTAIEFLKRHLPP